jgi:AcrR family transcriptional regulator
MAGAPVRRGRPPADPSTPRGREEVERALVDAAATLFGARGPEAVSVRDIASEAGVNHGLVHRYFGSKEGLLGAVLDRLAADVAAQLSTGAAGAPGTDGTDDVVDRYWRVLARAILDGRQVATLQHEFPTVGLVKQALVYEHGYEEPEAARRAAHILALEMGWRMFEPFLVRAAELEDDEPADRRRSLADASRRLAGDP